MQTVVKHLGVRSQQGSMQLLMNLAKKELSLDVTKKLYSLVTVIKSGKKIPGKMSAKKNSKTQNEM